MTIGHLLDSSHQILVNGPMVTIPTILKIVGIVIGIDYEGVLAADLPNGMKAGEILRLNGKSEFTFRDEKIYRITDIS